MVQYLSGVQRKWLLFLPRTNFLSAPRKQTPPPAFASPQVHILHSGTIVLLCFCTFVLLYSYTFAHMRVLTLLQLFANFWIAYIAYLEKLLCLDVYNLSHLRSFCLYPTL